MRRPLFALAVLSITTMSANALVACADDDATQGPKDAAFDVTTPPASDAGADARAETGADAGDASDAPDDADAADDAADAADG